MELTKENIKFFLTGIIKGDLDDPKVAKKIVETFVKSVVVYDDRINIFLNYSEEKNRQRFGFERVGFSWATNAASEPFL